MMPVLLFALLLGDPISTVTLETPEGAHEPQVAIGGPHFSRDPVLDEPEVGQPRVYVTYATRSVVYVSISANSGETFGRPIPVGRVGSLALGMRRGPRIAVVGQEYGHDDPVVVTAIGGEFGGGRDGDLLCWRSTDEGNSWKTPHRVNDVAGSAREGLHAMAVGPKAELYCVWIDLASGSPRICGSASGDAGENWSPAGVVCSDSAAICPCCHPSVAFGANGKLFVMWRGQEKGSRDMVVADSTDFGRTFSRPRKLGTGTWRIDACPMDGGSVISFLGRTQTVWRRDRSVYRSELLGPEILLGEGEQPCLASGPEGLYVLWLRKRAGPLVLSWTWHTTPIELDSVANDPAIVSMTCTQGPVIAVWESGPAERAKIVAARIDGPQPGAKR